MKKIFNCLIVLFIILALLLGGYFYLKQKIIAYAVYQIRENAMNLPISYTDIKQDTCSPGICLTINGARLSFLNQQLELGNIEIGLLLRYPWTVRLSNTGSPLTNNYLIARADISQHHIHIHQLDFHLSPLSGHLAGQIVGEQVDIRGTVQNLRRFMQQNWHQFNIRLPVELTYFLSDMNQTVQFNRQNDWIYMNKIPLFPVGADFR